MNETPADWAPKIKPCGYDAGLGRMFRFWCEGCKSNHIINCEGPIRPQWTFNWDAVAPTFSPSYHVTNPDRVCHLFIVDGRIQYLGDCWHELRGQTVDMKVIDPSCFPYELWLLRLGERDTPLEKLIQAGR